MTQSGYVFGERVSLPTGRWMLVVTKGDVWVFAPGRNFVMREHGQVCIDNHHGKATIRSLNKHGLARYRLFQSPA